MLGASSPGLLSATAGYRRVADAFSAPGMVQAYLDFEAALARAQMRAGLFPEHVATEIAAVCKVDRFDLEALGADTAHVAYPIVPLVKAIEAACRPEVGKHVHHGATTQDVMDTALLMITKREIKATLARMDTACLVLAELADKYRDTVMAGRSKLQHGAPTTFGFKVAQWLDLLSRRRRLLARAIDESCAVQFGGGVGTLAAHGDAALTVRSFLAQELRLRDPGITWHVQRDRLADIAHAIVLATTAIAKIGQDTALLSITEIGEISESAIHGRGGSSTMPQKRNPILSEALIEAGRLARPNLQAILEAQVHDQDRGLGFAHVERNVLCEATSLLAGSTDVLCELLSSIMVNPEAMRDNIDADHGTIVAEAAFKQLIKHLGRYNAHSVVSKASEIAGRGGTTFAAALLCELETLAPGLTLDLVPEKHVGDTADMIDWVINAHNRNASLSDDEVGKL